MLEKIAGPKLKSLKRILPFLVRKTVLSASQESMADCYKPAFEVIAVKYTTPHNAPRTASNERRCKKQISTTV